MLFVWTNGDSGSFLVAAKDRDAVRERAILDRVMVGETREDAEMHFNKNDEVIEIDGFVGNRKDIWIELGTMAWPT